MEKGLSGGIIEITEYDDLPTPTRPGKPNTRYDLYRNGKLHRQRWTDGKGYPINDRDYGHSGDGHGIGFPHDHPWDNTTRAEIPIFPSPYFI